MLSAAKKRYLFAIYELGQTGKPIRSKDIASSLKLKPPSVSKMLNALSEDDLIEKEFYGTVTFTQSGAAMANQLYMDYLTLFAFFHQALEIPEFHARKDAIVPVRSFRAQPEENCFRDSRFSGSFLNLLTTKCVYFRCILLPNLIHRESRRNQLFRRLSFCAQATWPPGFASERFWRRYRVKRGIKSTLPAAKTQAIQKIGRR